MLYTQTVNEEGKMSWSQMIFTTGIVAILIMGGSLAWLWGKLPPELPWLFSMPWGEQQLIRKELFAGMLGGLLVLFLITNGVSEWIGKRDEITKNTILGGGLLVVLMYLAGFLKVISIILGI